MQISDEQLDSIYVESFKKDRAEHMRAYARATIDAALRAQADARPVVAWRVQGAFTELFTDLEEACKYAMTIRAKVEPLVLGHEEPQHCQCPACRNGVIHASDCAVHNEPAYPNGPCNCGAITHPEASAPGLSEDEKKAMELAIDMIHSRFGVGDKSADHLLAILDRYSSAALQAHLTRASAATVDVDPGNPDRVLPKASAATVAELPRDYREGMEKMSNKQLVSRMGQMQYRITHLLRENEALRAKAKAAQQQAEPSDPTGLIARLRIHAEDRANPAFARSSMREAAGVLEDRQAEPVKVYPQGVMGIPPYDPRATGSHKVTSSLTWNAQQADPGADERAAFEAWALKTSDGNCCEEDLQLWESGDGDLAGQYVNALVERDWLVWQARAAQSGQRAASTSDDLWNEKLILKIVEELNIMFASAQCEVDESDGITGYRVKTGALHRIVGALAGIGQSVSIPANMPVVGQREGVAKGWQLVPKEPAPEMLKAMLQADMAADYTGMGITKEQRYLAMYRFAIEAAPTQQQEGGEREWDQEPKA